MHIRLHVVKQLLHNLLKTWFPLKKKRKGAISISLDSWSEYMDLKMCSFQLGRKYVIRKHHIEARRLTHVLGTLTANVNIEILVQPPSNNCSFLIIWRHKPHRGNFSDISECLGIQHRVLARISSVVLSSGRTTTTGRVYKVTGMCAHRGNQAGGAAPRSSHKLRESQTWKARDAHAEDGMASTAAYRLQIFYRRVPGS